LSIFHVCSISVDRFQKNIGLRCAMQIMAAFETTDSTYKVAWATEENFHIFSLKLHSAYLLCVRGIHLEVQLKQKITNYKVKTQVLTTFSNQNRTTD